MSKEDKITCARCGKYLQFDGGFWWPTIEGDAAKWVCAECVKALKKEIKKA